ncbi:MAG: T9SS type A sorting domain-containing protein [Chitinophagaceae bacterium]
MKKIYLVFVLFLISYVSFADNESICVLSNSTPSGEICSPTNLGPINPCGTLFFKVKGDLPASYAMVAKYEWFVNGVSVRTTTDPSDPILQWVIISRPTNVYCKVTYKKTDGTLSAPYTSTTFTPTIKDLNFLDITTSTPPPNYGCTTSTVSYSLNTYTCTSFCDYTYNVGQYNITWQPPAGWVQTSISANGNDVSFTPDAASAGPLIATIHLTCGYTDTRTFNTSRVAEAPAFTTSSVKSCTSSANMSINSTCGASNYSYTIAGNPGVTFTSNGLQTLTTPSTTINISIAGGSSINTIKAKANYPNNISSTDASATLTAGSPQPGPINVLLADPYTGKIQVEVDVIPEATDYRWYKNGVLQTIYHGTFAQIPITKNLCDVSYSISVKATTCSTSALTYKDVYIPPCGSYYMVSPNPASTGITVSTDEGKTQTTENKTFDEVRIYDFEGTLKKYQPFNKVKTASINTSGLSTGTYIIEIVNGSYKERHQLIIQK